MLRMFILNFLLSCTYSVFAQSDFYPDYRSKRELFTRVTDKDARSDISTFAMGGIEESISKLPLKRLSPTNVGNDFITFEDGNFKAIITAEPFDRSKHKLTFYEEKYLVKIDNKAFFGDYGKVPKTGIKSVEVIINRDTIRVPPAALNDLFNPVFFTRQSGVEKSNNALYFSADGKRFYIYMLKPEVGGSYEVTWVFEGKNYVRRVVDFNFLR